MKILIACEESQVECIAFREKGHEAYSCDIQECSGGHPEWHINQDVIPLLNGSCEFTTEDGVNHVIKGKWDMIIAHPPCTYLTNTGSRWYDVSKYGAKAIERERERAVEFFMRFVNADCDKVAIENPVGYMNSHFRKADVIYNPYDFENETECKKTCLWLKGLPKLHGTRKEPLPKEQRTTNGFKAIFNGKQYRWNDPLVAKLRSKTPLGVARAMAEQWG